MDLNKDNIISEEKNRNIEKSKNQKKKRQQAIFTFTFLRAICVYIILY